MTREEIYDMVNACESREELSAAILKIADANGEIQGRTRKFNAEKMAKYALSVVSEGMQPNVLTREFGIRQQAMYLSFHFHMDDARRIAKEIIDEAKKKAAKIK
jgi:hypothetical protein